MKHRLKQTPTHPDGFLLYLSDHSGFDQNLFFYNKNHFIRTFSTSENTFEKTVEELQNEYLVVNFFEYEEFNRVYETNERELGDHSLIIAAYVALGWIEVIENEQ